MAIDDDSMKLGESTDQLTFSTIEENSLIATSLAIQARKSLDIFSRDLEPVVYNTKEFVQAISDLAIRSKYSRVRILVQEPYSCVHQGHRLVETAQRLTSYIEMRKPGPDFKNFNEAFLIADQAGLLHKQLADRFEGVACFDNPLKAKELTRFFTDVWETAEIDPDLRRLYL